MFCRVIFKDGILVALFKFNRLVFNIFSALFEKEINPSTIPGLKPGVCLRPELRPRAQGWYCTSIDSVSWACRRKRRLSPRPEGRGFGRKLSRTVWRRRSIKFFHPWKTAHDGLFRIWGIGKLETKFIWKQGKGFFLICRMDPKIVVCCEDRSAIQDDRSTADDEVSYSPKNIAF